MEYIKIPRNIIEQEWYRSANARILFLHLLLIANEQGQIQVGIRTLAKEQRLSYQSTRTALSTLVTNNVISALVTQSATHQLTQSVTQSVTHHNTIITICNYESYKCKEKLINAPTNAVSNAPTNAVNNANEEKNKTKKEEFPPHPPIEEKNKTKKEDFTENQRFSTHKNVCVCACEGKDGTTEKKEPKAPPKAPLIDKRREEFRMSLEPYEQKYGKEMCENFFNYWSEYNRSRTKMRCELQKTWQLSGRLATWAKNDYRINQPSIVYGNTNSNGYIAPELRATQERREQEERLAVRIRQLAEEDGGGM